MLNQPAATARLTREMIDTEVKIAYALVSTTALLHSCALAARDNQASAALVQTAFLRSQKAISGLISARAEASRTHGALREIFREVAGPEEPYPCPKEEVIFTGAQAADENIAA